MATYDFFLYKSFSFPTWRESFDAIVLGIVCPNGVFPLHAN